MSRSFLTITRIQPNIGAEVGGVDLRETIPPEVAEALRAALLEHQVLVLRDQQLTREQHRAFASVFARNREAPFFRNETQARPIPGYPEILNVFADGMNKTAADVWHTDGSWCEVPPEVSVLRSTKVMPSLGGDTVFSSAGAAYDGLPDVVKQQIRDLKALHWKGYVKKEGVYGGLADDARMEKAKLEFPPVAHPVVRIHPETLRPTLFVNPVYTGPVVGMDEAAGEKLLNYLFGQIQKPDYQMRLRWTTDALAVWDNRAVQHLATANYSEPRMLERMTCNGVGRVLGFADLENGSAAPSQTVEA